MPHRLLGPFLLCRFFTLPHGSFDLPITTRRAKKVGGCERIRVRDSHRRSRFSDYRYLLTNEVSQVFPTSRSSFPSLRLPATDIGQMACNMVAFGERSAETS